MRTGQERAIFTESKLWPSYKRTQQSTIRPEAEFPDPNNPKFLSKDFLLGQRMVYYLFG